MRRISSSTGTGTLAFRTRIAPVSTCSRATTRRFCLPAWLRMSSGPVRKGHCTWAFLGTFRPGEDATRLYGEFDGDDFRLDYGLPNGDELQYLFRSGRIAQVEVHQEGHAVHRVLLAWGGGRELPSEATYRNLSSRSQLKVAVGTVERVVSHPSDIWYLVP